MTRRASPDQLPGVSAGSATKVPEGPQTLQAARRRVAGDQRGIQGADRGAGQPVGHDARLFERLVDAGLKGAERAAAAQHQRELAAGARARRDLAYVSQAVLLLVVSADPALARR
jgi:hypothetical protein